MGAFLTNDLAVVRARDCLVNIGAFSDEAEYFSLAFAEHGERIAAA